MKRKYGDSIETILSYYEEIPKLAEADFLEGGTGDLEALLAKKTTSGSSTSINFYEKERESA